MFTIDYNKLYNPKTAKKFKADKVLEKVQTLVQNNAYALFKNIDNASVKDIIATADHVKKNFTDLVVVGIGGSSLGTQGLLDAVKYRKGIKVHMLDNVDPNFVTETLNKVNLKTTCFNFVSKSGNTVEILSVLQVILAKLKTAASIKKQIIVTTTNTNNPLMKFANKYALKVLFMPNEIVGRFSGLSAVGLFPAACAGIDIKKILKGSADMLATITNPLESNEVMKFSLLQADMLKKKKYDLVILPYNNNLTNLFVYYAQTLAESLGKVNECPSSTVMVGANCQHSFFEQVLEGRDYRYTMLVKLNKFDNDIKLENNEVYPLTCSKLSEVINAECVSTLKTLSDHKRPSFLMEVDDLSEHSVGALFTFMQMTICFVGLIFDIDAFSQPAVEELKVNIHKLIG